MWIYHCQLATLYNAITPVPKLQLQGPLLLAWINFNSNTNIISNRMPSKVWDEIAYSFPNLTVKPLTFGNG